MRALISGVTGQDGPYLAGQLVADGHTVYGLVRGQMSSKWREATALVPELRLIRGDLLDQSSLQSALAEARPDVVYNLAALSFVGTSWIQPEVTAQVTGLGCLRLLNAIRYFNPDIRFVQASSSEMFGSCEPGTRQDERTPFAPRSPYAIAKVFAHHATVNYRESYDIRASTAICFNHECLAASTPLIVRECGVLNVTTADDLVPLQRKGPSVQAFTPNNLEVWADGAWTQVLAVTATRRRKTDPDHELLSVEARGGVVQVTGHHTMLKADGSEVEAQDLMPGDEVLLCDSLPEPSDWTAITPELAELLGLLAADGYVNADGHHIHFTNNDPELRKLVADLWSRTFLGTSREWQGNSGFNPEIQVGQMNLTGASGSVTAWLREQLYTDTGYKRVPPIILNSGYFTQGEFLRGYYSGDGLKKGNGQSITTNSPVLAQGLTWMYSARGQIASVYVEQRNGTSYYTLNLSSSSFTLKGRHFRKPQQEVRQIRLAAGISMSESSGGGITTNKTADRGAAAAATRRYRARQRGEDAPKRKPGPKPNPEPKPATNQFELDNEWVFDIETESGVFTAGVGRLVVHNSPRRGHEFVTRKITEGVARIKCGQQKELVLGRLAPMRDWGWAPEYMEALPLIAARDEPGDYVLATGVCHSVGEWCETAFSAAGLDWRKYVRSDERYFRPAEVGYLCGDAGKAKRELGWEARRSFDDIVRLMVAADLNEVRD